jgi:serine/threonine protein kinase/WD40 repeat protein
MNEPPPEFDSMEEAAESFVERYRRGERPALSEYTARYPELAERIRALFPALVMMEKVGSLGGEPGPQGIGAATEGPQVPGQLGEYRLVREIGRGGMGIVYEAVQESLGRHVALKVLPLHAALAPTQLERFRREAQAAARLHHTNIVPVFGVGEHQGLHYYAMQFIQGQGLESVLHELLDLRRRGKTGEPGCVSTGSSPGAALGGSVAQGLLSGQFVPPTVALASGNTPGELHAGPDSSGSSLVVAGDDSELTAQSEAQYFRSIARVGAQVAEALAHAHQQGIIHRDIKPSNLLLDTRGTVWVTDFGLAKAVDADELTQPGDIVGTLRYMAPERFQGVTDARGDVYGLGATLYELVTLRPAFDDTDRLRLMKRVSQEAPAPPRRLDPRIPRDLETIILKALAKEPGQRYQTADALAEDLRCFLADQPIRARRSSLLEQSWRWCRRNPTLAALLGLVAACLLAVVLIAMLDAARLRKEEEATRQQLRQTQQAEDEGRRRLFRALLHQARGSRRSRSVGQRFDSMTTLAEATRLARELDLPESDFLELRNEVIACLALPDLRVAREWDGWPEGTAHFDFDDKLERYARVDPQGNITVCRVADDTEACHFLSGIGDCSLHFSRDGRFLLAGGVTRCKVWELGDQGPRLILSDEQSCACSAFSPDSRQFALARVDGSITLYDLASGRQLRRFFAGPAPVHIAFHPQGRQLAMACRAHIEVRDVETGAAHARFPHPSQAEWVAWSAEGKTLATVGRDRLIYLWDVASGKLVNTLRGQKTDGIKVTFNRSGELLASTDWEGMLRLWDPRTGQELFHTPVVWADVGLKFHPDDRMFASSFDGAKAGIWEVAASHACRTLVRDPTLGKGEFEVCAFSPKGRVLAAGMRDGFGLWECRTGAFLAFVKLPYPDYIAFDPSGALLTNGPGNMLRWPIRPGPVPGRQVRVGPPERLPLPAVAQRGVACSADGRVMVSAQPWGGLVWHSDQPGKLIPLKEHPDTRSIAVSPDGNWVVTASWNGRGAKVWEARTGQQVKELLPEEGQIAVCFSPNGKWLATSAWGRLRLWAVPSLHEQLRIGGLAFAFSPDGRLLAVESEQGAVRLLAPDTGQEYARLEGPNQGRALWVAFSPDSAQLVVNGERQVLHLWDLRVVRAELSVRGLDWGLPPCGLATESDNEPPLEVAVDSGELAQSRRSVEERARANIEQYRQALARKPEDALTCNNLAWAYLTAPEPLRDAKEAVLLAEKAIRKERGNPMYCNTLGLAYYRTGQYRQAVAVLRPNLQSQDAAALAYDLFILAMSCYRLGETERARDYYTWAVRNSDAQKEPSPAELGELRALRAEAEAVLGLPTPPAPEKNARDKKPK